MKIYEYPDASKADVKRIRTLASRVGRSFYDEEKYKKHYPKLKEYMETIDNGRLNYWKDIMLIDHRWSGATGTGAYIAVASRVVNEISEDILRERGREWKEKYGDDIFVGE